MVTRKKNNIQTDSVCELIISREDMKNKIQERIQKGLSLYQRSISNNFDLEDFNAEYRKWSDFNAELLKRSFTNEDFKIEYDDSGYSGLFILDPSLGERISDSKDNLQSKIRVLESIMERLELIPISHSIIEETTATKSTSTVKTKKVFIVHGRDDVSKTSLEVFLREIGLEPIVLHRQADVGQTVIEKFEANSDVGFAFILLTPDEIAYLRTDDSLPDSERNKELRARPNVMFEFGYFVGKLGRSKVCCLYTGEVAIPSDLNGLIYKQYNANVEEVAYSIIKDLKATGYDIK
ncbi:TPA: nucleotide-binding protein [Citrobacter amalonaticus]|nr:nucleotide-binding protein [Citrobacter amalonaticus]HCL6056390.1 nucleotide-binding protein [Citrobacter amalonaticus]HED1789652.1 nucleotide-binding protein [Citrobacter amalonaticus]